MTAVLERPEVAFYQKGPFDQYGASPNQTDTDRLKHNTAFRSFLDKCLGGFSQVAPDSKRRIALMNNGDKPISPFENSLRNSFRAQAAEVVVSYCRDFFPDPEGAPDISGGWANIAEIAPRVVSALIDPRSVPLIDRGEALNILASGLHIARFPQTQIVIRTGYGGSDSPYTTSRFAAYSEPAFQIAERVKKVYQDRAAHKISGAAAKKARETGSEEALTKEEIDSVLTKANVARNPVRVDFFSAHNIAKAVNEDMVPEQIDQRAQDNEQVLRDHAQRYHPDIPVNVLSDIPQERLSPTQKFIHRFLTELLDRSTDPKIREALAVAEQLGGNRGGQVGQAKSLMYTSSHAQLYGDRMNLPYSTFLTEQPAPRILFTIGCRTERIFRTIREYCQKNANPQGYKAFLREFITQAADQEEIRDAQVALDELHNWMEAVAKKRPSYDWNNPKELDPADFNIHEIFGITQIGSVVPYYPAVFEDSNDEIIVLDRPNGTDIDKQRQELAEMLENRKSHIPTSMDGEAERRSVIERVIADLDILIDLTRLASS